MGVVGTPATDLSLLRLRPIGHGAGRERRLCSHAASTTGPAEGAEMSHGQAQATMAADRAHCLASIPSPHLVALGFLWSGGFSFVHVRRRCRRHARCPVAERLRFRFFKHDHHRRRHITAVRRHRVPTRASESRLRPLGPGRPRRSRHLADAGSRGGSHECGLLHARRIVSRNRLPALRKGRRRWVDMGQQYFV